MDFDVDRDSAEWLIPCLFIIQNRLNGQGSIRMFRQDQLPDYDVQMWCTFIMLGLLSIDTIYNQRLLYFLSISTFFTANVTYVEFGSLSFALQTFPKVPQPILSSNLRSLLKSTLAKSILCVSSLTVGGYFLTKLLSVVLLSLLTCPNAI